MSRHLIRTDSAFAVYVGYDDPLDTFFAQVLDVPASREEEDDVYAVNVGTFPQEVTSVDEVAEAIREYVPVAEVVRRLLEKARATRVPPTEFQRQIFKATTGKDLP